jgi:hypothetical protein
VRTAVEMHGLVDDEDVRLSPKHNIPNNENFPSHLPYKRGEEEGGGDSLASYSFGSLSLPLSLSLYFHLSHVQSQTNRRALHSKSGRVEIAQKCLMSMAFMRDEIIHFS